MCTYVNLHDSFGGSVSISLKKLLFCVDLSSPWCRSERGMEVKTQVGWKMCMYFHLIHLVVLSVFI